MFRRKEVPVQIIFDQNHFQQIVTQVRELMGDLKEATDSLERATLELRKAKKDLDISADKVKSAKRRPTIINH